MDESNRTIQTLIDNLLINKVNFAEPGFFESVIYWSVYSVVGQADIRVNLRARYRRLSFWNKLFVWGAVTSLISFPIAIWTLVPRDAATRPYIIVESTELVVPTDPTQPIQVVFDLKNTGQSEAIGWLRDFTYYFSVHPEQREFAYQRSEPAEFSLAPSERWRGHFLPTFFLTPEKLEALNRGSARLFVYARGEYQDSGGKRFELPFARMYHPVVTGHLAMVPHNITFKAVP